MNNEIKEAIQIISKIFPVSYAYTDSVYQNVHSSTCGINRIICESRPENATSSVENVQVELEMAQIQKAKHNAVDVIKLSTSPAGTHRKFNLLIDISNLVVKPSTLNTNTNKLLCNSKFITCYMRLSQREKEVLKQLALMRTSEEIASNLFISPNTVKNHRRNIKKKIDFNSRESYSRFLRWVSGFMS